MMSYTISEEKLLLTIARQSIFYGITHGSTGTVREDLLPINLQQLGASFVTLHLNGQLRGCIGSVKAIRPIARDVAINAYLAGFEDHRFLPVKRDDFEKLVIDISLLSELEPILFDSEQALIQKIRPHIDGLVIQAEDHRGVFLPIVWEILPHPQDFFKKLKQKAGLAENYWAESIMVWRFTTHIIHELR
jgi:uncharacterized protein